MLKGHILLRDDLSAAVTFSVLVHEVAHELLHAGDRPATTTKTVRKTEAEAVAFVVSRDRSRHRHGGERLQLYAGNKETILASLGAIQHAATEILTALHPDRP